MSKLKPCPFCGSECIITKFNMDKYYWHECGDCSIITDCHNTEQESTEAWNNRPLESELINALKHIVNATTLNVILENPIMDIKKIAKQAISKATR